MPYLKYRANCKTCMLCKKDMKLRRRIRAAAFNRQPGDETISDIAKEYDVSMPSMYNHVKKHMTEFDDTGRKEIHVAKNVATIQATVQKELEVQLDRDSVDDIDARPIEIAGLDDYIAQGIKEIKEGKLRVTPASFLGAVKIKTDWSSKQQNNKIELMRTILSFRSGANKKIERDTDGNNTRAITETIDRGEEQSDIIYRAAFGDATPQGSETIYQE